MGHDLLFTEHSHAPVTTLVVKDRILAHNPLGQYTQNTIETNFYSKTEASSIF